MKSSINRQKRGGGGFIRAFYVPDEVEKVFVGKSVEKDIISSLNIEKWLKKLKEYLPFSKFPNEYLEDCIYYQMVKYNFDNSTIEDLNIIQFGKFVTEEGRYELWKLLRVSFEMGDFTTRYIDEANQYSIYCVFETYMIALLNSKSVDDIIAFQELLKQKEFSSIFDAYDFATKSFKSVYDKVPQNFIFGILNQIKKEMR